MQRPISKQSRGANAEEKRYQGWIKESNHCAACKQYKPVICHHCEGSTFRHLKTLIGHFFCIGLCLDCDNVITLGSRRKFREEFGPQSGLWLISHDDYVLGGNMGANDEVINAIAGWGR